MYSRVIRKERVKKKQNQTHIRLFIISVGIITLLILSGCTGLKSAYVPDDVLTNGWHENLALRSSSIQFFGLDRCSSITYEITGRYPAFLTVTTIKTLVLMDEEELLKQTEEIIRNTLHGSVDINESSKTMGERFVKKGHKTLYIVCDGADIGRKKGEMVRIIGEVWNCGVTGTSIICIGVAYVTNKTSTPNYDDENWKKIVTDPSGSIGGFTGRDGLIYNVVCH